MEYYLYHFDNAKTMNIQDVSLLIKTIFQGSKNLENEYKTDRYIRILKLIDVNKEDYTFDETKICK